MWPPTVAPAQAGAQWLTTPLTQRRWIPACAGMTSISES
ncbi:hypothetical protein GP5015_2426 [gamma proteobacterium HTCC5015]|nr:hypothetical protein GP5015_2426 [gamma proteobacterium HTCC5015]